MSLIKVEHISKEFRISKRDKGVFSSLKALTKRQYEVKKAVDDISFEIAEGEIVGYIGSNGAGKSTTIKMLAGILVPTKGHISIDNSVPYLNRKTNAQKIGVVFGQRSQLYWNLPMEETFDLYKKIYKIDGVRFKNNIDFFVGLLDMESFLRTPVRQLSLGQRMRAELVVSLLHDPKILYLDEPTIGLDIMVKRKIRKFIRQLNEEKKTTVILTTHDMDDIDRICNRIITIESGRKIYDGSLNHFKEQYGIGHRLIVSFKEDDIGIEDNRLKIIKQEAGKMTIQFDKEKISIAECLSILSRAGEVVDLKVVEPNIEEAIENLYISNA